MGGFMVAPASRLAGRSRVVATLAGLLALALSSLVVASPAEAVPASKLLGHRCHVYDASVTNEDTVAALKDVAAGAPGAWCEIDKQRLRVLRTTGGKGSLTVGGKAVTFAGLEGVDLSGMTTAEAVYSSQLSNWNGSRHSRRSSSEVITLSAPRACSNSFRADVSGTVALTSGRRYTGPLANAKPQRAQRQEGLRWEAGRARAPDVPSPRGPRTEEE